MAHSGHTAEDERVHRELGRRLRRARARLHLTQRETADAAGVSLRTVARIELGHAFLSARSRRLLADWLGTVD